jgi:Ca-activated chloride channel family protein
VDRVKAARERFERALVEGRTAALVEQERGSLFTQELGNVPPGAEVVAEITVDQRLLWRTELGDRKLGGWEWRFPLTVSPRYHGAAGRVPEATRVEVPVADGPVGARLSLSLAIRDVFSEGGQVESPSHAVRSSAAGGVRQLSLAADGGVPLDRDLVIRWPVAALEPGLTLSVFARPGDPARSFGLLTLVPPAGAAPALSRDLVLLLDVSGSMSGEPLEQSRRVAQALVESLGPDDRLEMIAFASEPERWRSRPAEATPANRKAALAWLDALRASGGTEMREGLREALRPLRESAQRQVVLFTDGQIGFEQEIVAALASSLPAGSRLHTVGVGSAVNRSLTGPAARAGRGREVVIGLGEDPERAASVLVAHTAAPLVTGLALSGSAVKAHAPVRPGDLYAGAPALVALELSPAGGDLLVTGQAPGGAFERHLHVPAAVPGEGQAAVAALFAREAVEDLEQRVAAGEPHGPLELAIERLGLDLQIATRLTAWVAISEQPTVDPGLPTRREAMPHALPHGVSAEGLGLRAFSTAAPVGAARARVALMRDATLGEEKAGTVSRLYQSALGPEPSDEEPSPSAGPGQPPSPAPSFMGPSMGAKNTAKKARARPGGRSARARVALVDGDRLVLELTCEDALGWAPPGTATLRHLLGEATLAVKPDGTTRTCEIAAGATLRLVLDLGPLDGEALASLTELELALPDGTLLVAVFES